MGDRKSQYRTSTILKPHPMPALSLTALSNSAQQQNVADAMSSTSTASTSVPTVMEQIVKRVATLEYEAHLAKEMINQTIHISNVNLQMYYQHFGIMSNRIHALESALGFHPQQQPQQQYTQQPPQQQQQYPSQTAPAVSS